MDDMQLEIHLEDLLKVFLRSVLKIRPADAIYKKGDRAIKGYIHGIKKEMDGDYAVLFFTDKDRKWVPAEHIET